jgi:hypothetical protein
MTETDVLDDSKQTKLKENPFAYVTIELVKDWLLGYLMMVYQLQTLLMLIERLL